MSKRQSVVLSYQIQSNVMNNGEETLLLMAPHFSLHLASCTFRLLLFLFPVRFQCRSGAVSERVTSFIFYWDIGAVPGRIENQPRCHSPMALQGSFRAIALFLLFQSCFSAVSERYITFIL